MLYSTKLYEANMDKNIIYKKQCNIVDNIDN